MPRGIPRPKRRCRAIRSEWRGGEQCKNAAIQGGRVCKFHGGAAPQTIASARKRISEAARTAIDVIIELMADPRVPYAVRLAAARDLADRAGLGAGVKLDVDVNVSPDDPTIQAMVAKARVHLERRALERDAPIEAEVIEDDD